MEVLAVFLNIILPLGLNTFMQRTALIAVLQSDLVLNISLLIAPLACDHTDLSGEGLSFDHLRSVP